MDQLHRHVVLGKGTNHLPDSAHDFQFIHEILTQSKYALCAVGELLKITESEPTSLAICAYAHMFLVFAGNVSKLLFPDPKAKPRIRDRAKRLCHALHVDPHKSLLRNKSLRNFLEHFDERMDRYLTADYHGVICPRGVGPSRTDDVILDDGRVLPIKFLVRFDTDQFALEQFGTLYPLAPLHNELFALSETSSVWLEAEIARAKSTVPQPPQPPA